MKLKDMTLEQAVQFAYTDEFPCCDKENNCSVCPILRQCILISAISDAIKAEDTEELFETEIPLTKADFVKLLQGEQDDSNGN